jgi:hypothetical protein
MTPRIRMAALAGLMLVATAGLARAAATSYPAGVEKTMEAPKVGTPYVDYANCPTPQMQQEVQIQATLQLPAEERGRAIEKGSCAVANPEAAPSTVDNRYAIGH